MPNMPPLKLVPWVTAPRTPHTTYPTLCQKGAGSNGKASLTTQERLQLPAPAQVSLQEIPWSGGSPSSFLPSSPVTSPKRQENLVFEQYDFTLASFLFIVNLLNITTFIVHPLPETVIPSIAVPCIVPVSEVSSTLSYIAYNMLMSSVVTINVFLPLLLGFSPVSGRIIGKH